QHRRRHRQLQNLEARLRQRVFNRFRVSLRRHHSSQRLGNLSCVRLHITPVRPLQPQLRPPFGCNEGHANRREKCHAQERFVTRAPVRPPPRFALSLDPADGRTAPSSRLPPMTPPPAPGITLQNPSCHPP